MGVRLWAPCRVREPVLGPELPCPVGSSVHACADHAVADRRRAEPVLAHPFSTAMVGNVMVGDEPGG